MLCTQHLLHHLNILKLKISFGLNFIKRTKQKCYDVHLVTVHSFLILFQEALAQVEAQTQAQPQSQPQVDPSELVPRLCHLVRSEMGYGFNLHSERSRPGQYIRSLDPGSPADHAGLRPQDRLVEVGG